MNQVWKKTEVRLSNNMIDICTVSDEVFVWMAVQESSEQWIKSYKEREAYEHGHGSLKKVVPGSERMITLLHKMV